MAVDVVMPQMGESIFEGTITKWLKKPGDKVERDEPLFEISTDKVDAEIPSPSAGVLQEIKIPEGQTVPIQTVVAVIDGAALRPLPPLLRHPHLPHLRQLPLPRQRPVLRLRQHRRRTCPAPAPAPAASPPRQYRGGRRRGNTSERVHSSPLVRRLAKEHNIDLTTLEGTGAGGRITKEDIEAAIAAQSAAAARRSRKRTVFRLGSIRLRCFAARAASSAPAPLARPARLPFTAASMCRRCRWAFRANACTSAITKCSR